MVADHADGVERGVELLDHREWVAAPAADKLGLLGELLLEDVAARAVRVPHHDLGSARRERPLAGRHGLEPAARQWQGQRGEGGRAGQGCAPRRSCVAQTAGSPSAASPPRPSARSPPPLLCRRRCRPSAPRAGQPRPRRQEGSARRLPYGSAAPAPAGAGSGAAGGSPSGAFWRAGEVAARAQEICP